MSGQPLKIKETELLKIPKLQISLRIFVLRFFIQTAHTGSEVKTQKGKYVRQTLQICWIGHPKKGNVFQKKNPFLGFQLWWKILGENPQRKVGMLMAEIHVDHEGCM